MLERHHHELRPAAVPRQKRGDELDLEALKHFLRPGGERQRPIVDDHPDAQGFRHGGAGGGTQEQCAKQSAEKRGQTCAPGCSKEHGEHGKERGKERGKELSKE